MNPKAFEQAEHRLQRAEAALASLEQATTLDQLATAWSEFLLAASTIYSKLEQGSKGDNRSAAWFGRMKHTRRTDPLLSYIHHARNSDEHGIGEVVEKQDATIGLDNVSGSDLKISWGPDKPMTVEHFGGPMPDVTLIPPGIRLITVTDDRYNDSFDPPKEHLGIPLTDPSPLGVGRLAVKYLASLLAEAKAFVA